MGVTRMLEAMREVCPRGALLPGVLERDVRQGARGAADGDTPFYPRSPYGVAKAYGHFITVNYRESYDLHATRGDTFQPRVRLRDNAAARHGRRGTSRSRRRPISCRCDARAGRSRTSAGNVSSRSGTGKTGRMSRRSPQRGGGEHDPDHELLTIQARAGVVEVTAHHNDARRRAREGRRRATFGAGDELALAESRCRAAAGWTVATPEMAELLGLLAADGYVARDGGSVRLHEQRRAAAGARWPRCGRGCSSATPRSGPAPLAGTRTRRSRHVNLTDAPPCAVAARAAVHVDAPASRSRR